MPGGALLFLRRAVAEEEHPFDSFQAPGARTVPLAVPTQYGVPARETRRRRLRRNCRRLWAPTPFPLPTTSSYQTLCVLLSFDAAGLAPLCFLDPTKFALCSSSTLLRTRRARLT